MDHFDDRTKMSNVIQKIKFMVEQLGDSKVTNLINYVFLKAHGIIELAMVLHIYVDPPSHLRGQVHASWISLVDHWGNHGVMNSFD